LHTVFKTIFSKVVGLKIFLKTFGLALTCKNKTRKFAAKYLYCLVPRVTVWRWRCLDIGQNALVLRWKLLFSGVDNG